MKKIAIAFGLLMSGFSFGQIKAVPLNTEEVNRLAYDALSGFSTLKEETIAALNIKNTIGFLVEFQHEGKVIGKKIIKLYSVLHNMGASYSLSDKRVEICFKTKDLSDSINFNLLKTNHWKIVHPKGGEEHICTDHLGVDLFRSKDQSNHYQMNSLVDGKIQMILYRLE